MNRKTNTAEDTAKKMQPGQGMKTIVPYFLQHNPADLDHILEIFSHHPDFIELRLDACLSNADPDAILKHLTLLKTEIEKYDPDTGLILTVRTREQGGEAEISAADYKKFVLSLYDLDSLVDVELDKADLFDWNEDRRKRTILSWHDFEKTLSDCELEKIWLKMQSYHCGIEKIAMMPRTRRDVKRLLESCRNHQTDAKKIAVSMSELGVKSRLEGDLYGSFATFCTVREASAPGQVSLEQFHAHRKN